MSRPRIVETTEDLARALEELSGEARVGLDVEGDGLYRYRSRLCLMQIAAGERELVIDTLAIEELSPLAALLGPDGPEKVVHDVSFDVKMLDTRGLSLERVFDTSVAARFLSEPSTGLASLLDKYFGVKIDKKLQQADWGERPITEERLEYLVGDVRHLVALAERFEERVAAKDLAEEVEEETRYAIARAHEPETEREPWTRVKGRRDLDGPQLAVLRALADMREAEAERRDVPPFRVASNRVLFEAARRKPERLKDLRRIRGLSKIEDGPLEEALERARRDGAPSLEPDSPAPPAAERARRKAREKALSSWRKKEAQGREVDLQAVLPGHCLRDLAGLEELRPEALEEVAGFGAKRRRLYGEALLGLLREADASV